MGIFSSQFESEFIEIDFYKSEKKYFRMTVQFHIERDSCSYFLKKFVNEDCLFGSVGFTAGTFVSLIAAFTSGSIFFGLDSNSSFACNTKVVINERSAGIFDCNENRRALLTSSNSSFTKDKLDPDTNLTKYPSLFDPVIR